MSSVYDAVRNRRSCSKVTADTPDRDELLHLIEAAGRVADHSSLHPWRVIEIRGDARLALAQSFAQAEAKKKGTHTKKNTAGVVEGYARKTQRAELLLAVVYSPQSSGKVPDWEQEAVASGVAHALMLLLDDAGWGTIWRTGSYTRAKAVHRAHRLAKTERLLGWLYVGGKPSKEKDGRPRKTVNAEKFLTHL
ncbi:NAD(P)H nitroreductase [Klugiella xanthotipulae]|uniref:Putative NAD(P)H nitroreductase n=1 Tax=Klugiella xanthotipulae TaxID=244735 RepID=A0A543I509_9MICO|nr:nitroreductase family protein [Klugiella xanthotipulae]TQM65641.1 nitroreductase [Klugiella xanthotipulae]